MSFAFKRNGALWIGYTDQRGRAVMQKTSCTRLSHAAEVARRMEEMSARLGLQAATGLRKDESDGLRSGDVR